MKKKSDPNTKSLISKYISHFKTFDEIISNLGEKITNTGHSDTATLDAKNRLSSFVSNYNIFFHEFVDAYFKFNQEYLNWVNGISKQTDISQLTRNVSNKQIENRQKIKEFESFFTNYKENLVAYQAFNQDKLLSGLISKKNQELEDMKQTNMRLTRKINLMMDYNPETVEKVIED